MNQISEKLKKVLMWGTPFIGVVLAGYYIWYGDLSFGNKKNTYQEKVSQKTTQNQGKKTDSLGKYSFNGDEAETKGSESRSIASQQTHEEIQDSKEKPSKNLSYVNRKVSRSSSRCEDYSKVEQSGQGPLNANLFFNKGNGVYTQWSDVMAEFHSIKADLITWLNSGAKKLPKEVVAEMTKQIEELKLRRAPNSDEPDLSWRGIALWGLDKHGAPVINLGGGFIDWLNRTPERARFELARQVVMAWSPCELRRVGSGHPWGGLTECFSLEDTESRCTRQLSNETAWGISTAVAYQIRYPGCEPGALQAKSSCMKRIPASLWKE